MSHSSRGLRFHYNSAAISFAYLSWGVFQFSCDLMNDHLLLGSISSVLICSIFQWGYFHFSGDLTKLTLHGLFIIAASVLLPHSEHLLSVHLSIWKSTPRASFPPYCCLLTSGYLLHSYQRCFWLFFWSIGTLLSFFMITFYVPLYIVMRHIKHRTQFLAFYLFLLHSEDISINYWNSNLWC